MRRSRPQMVGAPSVLLRIVNTEATRGGGLWESSPTPLEARLAGRLGPQSPSSSWHGEVEPALTPRNSLGGKLKITVSTPWLQQFSLTLNWNLLPGHALSPHPRLHLEGLKMNAALPSTALVCAVK